MGCGKLQTGWCVCFGFEKVVEGEVGENGGG
jgi:hypothetical protein